MDLTGLAENNVLGRGFTLLVDSYRSELVATLHGSVVFWVWRSQHPIIVRRLEGSGVRENVGRESLRGIVSHGGVALSLAKSKGSGV